MLGEVASYHLDRRSKSGSKQKKRRKPALPTDKGKIPVARKSGEAKDAGAVGEDVIQGAKRKLQETDAQEEPPTKQQRLEPPEPTVTDNPTLLVEVPPTEAQPPLTSQPIRDAREAVPPPPLLKHLTIGIN
ncbi:hypothetical protein DACRYDRAFT_25361, partial [Dacryopinax primogenitus]